MALFSVIAQMLILLLTGLLIIFGNITVGTIASVGQISGNIFNSLSTINQLQVTIKSVDPILKISRFSRGSKDLHSDYSGCSF